MSSSTEPSRPEVYTIGHSAHEIEALLELLERHSITAVADVRSSPYSRMYPQYNREPLKQRLSDAGLAYVFLGQELGARSEDPSCYEDDRALYSRIARTEPFEVGLKRVAEGATRYDLALMCAEKDPLDCHRTILVARELEGRGYRIRDVLADGSADRHDATDRRLRRKLRIAEGDMFKSQSELDGEAYKPKGALIAFRRRAHKTAPE